MGVFMASLSFRKPEQEIWTHGKERIEKWLSEIDGLTSNLDDTADGIAIVSPYGEDAYVLAGSAQPISRMIQGYVIMASCVDSDFNLLEVFYNGESVEKCCIGELYEEYKEIMDCGAASYEFWKRLLLDESREEELRHALYGKEILAEDNLRLLSGLIGFPVFNDDLVFHDI